MISKNQFRKRQRQKIYLDTTLKDLALLILSPLLAITTWFLLVQTGVQDQQNGNNGHTGIFILAVVSFSVGLVTNEIVQYLINFVKERFQSSELVINSIEQNEKPSLLIECQILYNIAESGKQTKNNYYCI